MTSRLEAQGYAILPLKGLKKKMKATYYHPRTGEPCVLPADDYHKTRYLKRGFTLEPPEVKTEVKVEETEVSLPKGAGKCPVCGKTCKRVRTHYNLIHKGRNKEN